MLIIKEIGLPDNRTLSLTFPIELEVGQRSIKPDDTPYRLDIQEETRCDLVRVLLHTVLPDRADELIEMGLGYINPEPDAIVRAREYTTSQATERMRAINRWNKHVKRTVRQD